MADRDPIHLLHVELGHGASAICGAPGAEGIVAGFLDARHANCPACLAKVGAGAPPPEGRPAGADRPPVSPDPVRAAEIRLGLAARELARLRGFDIAAAPNPEAAGRVAASAIAAVLEGHPPTPECAKAAAAWVEALAWQLTLDAAVSPQSISVHPAPTEEPPSS